MRFPLIFFLLIFSFQFGVSQTAFQKENILIPYRSLDKWGYCDTLAQVVIEPMYDSVGFFSDDRFFNKEGLAVVVLAGKHGAIDKSGKIILPMLYDSIDIDSRDQFAILYQEGKRGIALLDGSIAIPIEYDNIYAFASSQGKGKQIIGVKGEKKFLYGFILGDERWKMGRD